MMPVTGEMRGRTHVLPVRVYYEDTDAAGIVYHANYLRYAERGRTEMLRAAGIELGRLKDEAGLVFVVHKGDLHYLKPARLDETLVVETDLVELGGASVQMRQVIKRLAAPKPPEDVVRFNVTVACMDTEGRAARLPPPIRATFKDLVNGSVG